MVAYFKVKVFAFSPNALYIHAMNRNILSVVVLSLVLIGVGWVVVRKNKVVPVVMPVDTATPINLDALTWKEYRSEELGISFEYPAELVDTEFFFGPGDTGRFFYGGIKFPSNNTLSVKTITRDYSTPKDGNWGAGFGYVKNKDGYFLKRPNATITLYEVFPHEFWQLNGGTEKALVLYENDFSTSTRENYYAPSVVATVNLQQETFPGLGFEYIGTPVDKEEIGVIKKLVTSIKFLK